MHGRREKGYNMGIIGYIRNRSFVEALLADGCISQEEHDEFDERLHRVKEEIEMGESSEALGSDRTNLCSPLYAYGRGGRTVCLKEILLYEGR